MIFYIVDVFAEEKYHGNQLAVFRSCGNLLPDTMQKIARETNFAETTFILSDTKTDNGYDVRIFTPDFEVPFAGHPTLGTAFVIHREIENELSGGLNLNLGVGRIPVRFEQDGYTWMRQKTPEFGHRVDPEKLCGILGIEIDDVDAGFPVQEVSTGLASIIVPLNSLDAVKRCKINHEKFRIFAEENFSANILVFSKETYNSENQLNVRVYADDSGYPEDAATGSANGNLAGYLLEYGYFNKNVLEYRVEQGYEMGRPSLLKVRAAKENGRYEIEVGGRVFLIAKGEWSL